MESYEKDWFVILMLILCFPVGLFLMWKYSKCHKIVKTIISVLLIAIVILSNGIKKPKNIETKDTNVEVETLTVDERKELQEYMDSTNQILSGISLKVKKKSSITKISII